MSDNPRSLEVDYCGPKHSGHFILSRWRLWLSVIGGTIFISTSMGAAAVWGGNQIWHTKEEAAEEAREVNEKIEKVTDSVDRLVRQIDRLQNQVAKTNDNLSDFILEAERQRLEANILNSESEIYQYENRIDDQEGDVPALYRERLQLLRSKRDRMKRELDLLYDSIPPGHFHRRGRR